MPSKGAKKAQKGKKGGKATTANNSNSNTNGHGNYVFKFNVGFYNIAKQVANAICNVL